MFDHNGERLRICLMCDASRLPTQWNGADVQFLNVVDAANGQFFLARQRQGVRERFAAEWTHVQDLLNVDVRVYQLLVVAENHRRSVRSGEDAVHVRRVTLEGLQRDGLGAEAQLFACAERARIRI